MKLDVFQKIGIIFGSILLLYILTDSLITEPVTKENSTAVIKNFKSIQRFKIENKVSISYDLFTQNPRESYKIIPDYADCFDFRDFSNEVKEGQLIKIAIKHDNGLRSSKIPIVISLIVNGKNYLNQDCINKEIKNQKFTIPLLCVGFIIIMTFLIYKKSGKRN